MSYFESASEREAYEEKMALLKPWQRPYDYRGETEPTWHLDYPLHELVERAKADDYPTELEDIDLDEVGDLLDEGKRLDEKDGEGYTVWDYVKGCQDFEAALRDCEVRYQIRYQVRQEQAAIGAETADASAVSTTQRI